jgi:hypothetical protein
MSEFRKQFGKQQVISVLFGASVAGLESLSLHQLECLTKLGEVCDVELLLVHPSPGLERKLAATLPESTPGIARRRGCAKSSGSGLLRPQLPH